MMPVTRSQRLTDMWGNIVAGIELDPWGGETNRSWNSFYQPHRYTSWERGWTGDESLFRRYHGWFSRFAHPDPYDGSYNSSDPQSFNRYAYVQNDPVNFVDPSGLVLICVELESGMISCWDDGQSVDVYPDSGLFPSSGGGIGHHPPLLGIEIDPGGGPQNPQRPEKKPNFVVVAKKGYKSYEDCVQTQWQVFNHTVEQVKAAADKHYEERKGPWLLDKIVRILELIPSGGEFDPGEGESLRDLINKQAGFKEIDEGTQRAAAARDQRIKNECKKP